VLDLQYRDRGQAPGPGGGASEVGGTPGSEGPPDGEAGGLVSGQGASV
jgi:hypothetical protein